MQTDCFFLRALKELFNYYFICCEYRLPSCHIYALNCANTSMQPHFPYVFYPRMSSVKHFEFLFICEKKQYVCMYIGLRGTAAFQLSISSTFHAVGWWSIFMCWSSIGDTCRCFFDAAICDLYASPMISSCLVICTIACFLLFHLIFGARRNRDF